MALQDILISLYDSIVNPNMLIGIYDFVINSLSGLYNLVVNSLLLAGLIGGITASVFNLLLPKFLNRYFNRYLPEVYVTAEKGTTFTSEKGLIYNYGLVLKVENNTDSPLSFFSPEFEVCWGPWGYFKKQDWREALLVISPSTLNEIGQDQVSRRVTIREGPLKSAFHEKRIRLEAHDLIDDYLLFELPGEPPVYNNKKGSWVVGKITIKPVGSKAIKKTVYFNRAMFTQVDVKAQVGVIPSLTTKVIKSEQKSN